MTASNTTIIPGHRYRNAPAAIEWLCTVLGFTGCGKLGREADSVLSEGGGGFNPRINPTESLWGFSPGRTRSSLAESPSFSAACLRATPSTKEKAEPFCTPN